MPLTAEHSWQILPITTAATALLIMLLTPLAHKTKLVDLPSQRKIHDSATPLVGGLAIFITLAIVFSGPCHPIASYRPGFYKHWAQAA